MIRLIIEPENEMEQKFKENFPLYAKKFREIVDSSSGAIETLKKLPDFHPDKFSAESIITLYNIGLVALGCEKAWLSYSKKVK